MTHSSSNPPKTDKPAETKAEKSAETSAPGTVTVDGIDLKVRGTVELPPLPPKPAARAETAPPLPPAPEPEPVVVPSYRDPACADLARHRPSCDCRGDARKPF